MEGTGPQGLTIYPGLTAGADLSASQYRYVKRSTGNTVVRCGAGEYPIGVLQNAPTSGQPASVAALDGKFGWLAVDGSTILVDSDLKSDADGLGTVTTTDNDVVGARAQEASSAAAVIHVQYRAPAARR